MASSKSTTVRVNISLPRSIFRDAKRALKRRAAVAAASGQTPTKTFSGFIKEKSVELVAAFK